MNRFLLDLLRLHYASKFLFDDTNFLSNVIIGLGNCLNIRFLHKTIAEIIRQAKIELSRSQSMTENLLSSHNYQVLASSIVALTQIYLNMKICFDQLTSNSKFRKANKQATEVDESNKANPHKSNAEKKACKIQAEIEAKRKLKPCIFEVMKFMRAFNKSKICSKVINLQVLYFRFRVTKKFIEEN